MECRFYIPGLLSVVTIFHMTTGMIFIKPHHPNGSPFFCNSPSSITCGADPKTDLKITCFLELAHFFFDAQSPLHTQALYQSCCGGQHLLTWPPFCSMWTFANNPYLLSISHFKTSFSYTYLKLYSLCVFHCFLNIYVCISILTHVIIYRLCSQFSLKG